MKSSAAPAAAQKFLSRLAAADGGKEQQMLQVSYLFSL
jgi:hypothetical protein